MTQNERRHKRFKLDLAELDGTMLLSSQVEILNMSSGGLSLRASTVLIPGKAYLITVAAKGKRISVKGIVVRSESAGTEERSRGGIVTLCAASMIFQDGQADTVAEFLDAIGPYSRVETPRTADRRRSVRFHITMPLHTMLSHSAEFKIRKISLSGMLVQSDQALAVNSEIPMGLSLSADNRVNFNGRVASCRMILDQGQAHHEIGVEFAGLTDKDRALLATFIDSLEAMEGTAEG